MKSIISNNDHNSKQPIYAMTTATNGNAVNASTTQTPTFIPWTLQLRLLIQANIKLNYCSYVSMRKGLKNEKIYSFTLFASLKAFFWIFVDFRVCCIHEKEGQDKCTRKRVLMLLLKKFTEKTVDFALSTIL